MFAESDKLPNQGEDLADAGHQLEFAELTWHRRYNRFRGVMADDALRLKVLEDENSRAKMMAFVCLLHRVNRCI